MPVNTLGGAFFVGPQQSPRPTGAEGLTAASARGVQPTAADVARPIEPGGEARGGLIERRADDARRGRSAFDELRRTLAGEDDPVTLSAEGRRKAEESAADAFARAFGGEGEPGEGQRPTTERSFDDLFARPRRPAAPPGDGSTEPEAAAEDADGAESVDDAAQATDAAERRSTDGDALTTEELDQVRQLEARDAEVRTHEQAHKSVGGRYAGAISFDYQAGPDGRRYAVGGEVSIDIGEVPGDPQATIQKMEIVRRAALAPAEPSGADRSVAAAAGQKAARARVELTEQRAEAAAEAREEASDGAEALEDDDATEHGDSRAGSGAKSAGEGPIRRLEPAAGGIFVNRDTSSGARTAALRATAG